MPELPEIEVFRDRLDEKGFRRTITTVSLRPDGMTAEVSDSTLRGAFRGHQLTASRRHGKQLFVRSGEERGRWLRLHFGMTGSLHLRDEGEEEPDHTRLRFDFEGGGSLAFSCPRKFGQIGLVDDPDRWVTEKGLGPDPLRDGFGLREFRELLEGRSGGVKATLTNQEILAGLGNVWGDEVLFQAGIHPETPTDELGDDRVEELWRALKRVLTKAVEYRAEVERMPGTWLRPNREEGTPCPRCDGAVRVVEVSGRSTFFCDSHQTR